MSFLHGLNIPCWASTHIRPIIQLLQVVAWIPSDATASKVLKSEVVTFEESIESFPSPRNWEINLQFFFWGGQGRVKKHICPSTRVNNGPMDQSLEVGLCSSRIYPWSLFRRCENNGVHVVFARTLQPSKLKNPLKRPNFMDVHGISSLRFFFLLPEIGAF